MYNRYEDELSYEEVLELVHDDWVSIADCPYNTQREIIEVALERSNYEALSILTHIPKSLEGIINGTIENTDLVELEDNGTLANLESLDFNFSDIMRRKLGIWETLGAYEFKEVSREDLLWAVEKDKSFLWYIYNPDEEVQMASVKYDLDAINYIMQPSKKVQLSVVERKPGLIDNIIYPSREAISMSASKGVGYSFSKEELSRRYLVSWLADMLDPLRKFLATQYEGLSKLGNKDIAVLGEKDRVIYLRSPKGKVYLTSEKATYEECNGKYCLTEESAFIEPYILKALSTLTSNIHFPIKKVYFDLSGKVFTKIEIRDSKEEKGAKEIKLTSE